MDVRTETIKDGSEFSKDGVYSTSGQTPGTLTGHYILGDPGTVIGGGKIFFSSPEVFSRPFRLFPAPTNCPWVSEDEVILEHSEA